MKEGARQHEVSRGWGGGWSEEWGAKEGAGVVVVIKMGHKD